MKTLPKPMLEAATSIALEGVVREFEPHPLHQKHNGFTCPDCGSHLFGTISLPNGVSIGCCHNTAANCHFKWDRRDVRSENNAVNEIPFGLPAHQKSEEDSSEEDRIAQEATAAWMEKYCRNAAVVRPGSDDFVQFGLVTVKQLEELAKALHSK
jgi:hypothetical protein